MRVNIFAGGRWLAIAAGLLWTAAIDFIFWADFGPDHYIWKNFRAFLYIAALAAAVTASARADTAQVPAALRCEFESYTSGLADEKASRISAEVKREPGIDTLIYSAIDPAEGTAQMVGNVGASTVTFIGTGTTWSFVEVTQTGNINVTQAFIWNEPEAAQHLYRAVHSRHSSFAGRIVVSQHYGHCKALN